MSWHLYILSGIFIIAGIFHFIKPKAFMRIMPLYIPYHKQLVYLSGITEIIAGIGLLFAQTRFFSIWSIICMLILFFPVHIHMLMNKKAGLNLPKSILIFRLLLQFGLIYWAQSYL
ncbi:DoxX family membrane protein [Aquimarina sp. AD1]|uniref:DoxX family protein n=1 Tax=Aquimarina sp. (strain AD1) TaxID=1714848 RepID=UPI000E48328C|nr:MauE/DoxX family redox-associated membrane protein [Aquimarina sp. AD1]AXT58442.1 DoxX family membrane protein [Aquimarina sp. AD1]RKN16810.1 DoxX family membrane protein [Aquimarina sp. AD1]